MKGKILFLSLFLVWTQSTYANIVVQPQGVATTDICSALPGTWTGQGTVKAGIVSCHYHGTAHIINATNKAGIELKADLYKDSGAFCPDKDSITLPGTCENGAIILASDDANLNGNIDGDGKAAHLNGEVSFSVLGKRVTAKVDDLEMQKQ